MSTANIDDQIGAITQSLFSQGKQLRNYRGEVRNDELHQISSQAQLLARLASSANTSFEPNIDPNLSMMRLSENYPSTFTAQPPQFNTLSNTLRDPRSFDPYIDPSTAATLSGSYSHCAEMPAYLTAFTDISPSNLGQEMMTTSPETEHLIRPFGREASLSVVPQEPGIANRPRGERPPTNLKVMWAPDQGLSPLAPLSRQSNQVNSDHLNPSASGDNEVINVRLRSKHGRPLLASTKAEASWNTYLSTEKRKLSTIPGCDVLSFGPMKKSRIRKGPTKSDRERMRLIKDIKNQTCWNCHYARKKCSPGDVCERCTANRQIFCMRQILSFTLPPGLLGAPIGRRTSTSSLEQTELAVTNSKILEIFSEIYMQIFNEFDSDSPQTVTDEDDSLEVNAGIARLKGGTLDI